MGCNTSKPAPAASNPAKQALIEAEAVFECLVKVVIVGDSGVGKSQLILKLAGEDFIENLSTTIGVDFRVIKIHPDVPHPEYIVTLRLSDTAGQERFRSISANYFNDAEIVLICFRLGDKDSFESLPYWLKLAKEHSKRENVQYLIVGLKADLCPSETEFKGPMKGSVEDNPLAGCPYYAVSSKNGQGVGGLKYFFHLLAESKMLARQRENNSRA